MREHDCECSECPECLASAIQSAIDAGIPRSVIEGKTKLQDHFSKEYIDFKRNVRENE